MKRNIVLLIICTISTNVLAFNRYITDSLHFNNSNDNLASWYESSSTLQFHNANYDKYAIEKKGMLFLRAELGTISSLSIGYGGPSMQAYLNAGWGCIMKRLGITGSAYRLSLGTRVGNVGKWGLALDVKLGYLTFSNIDVSGLFCNVGYTISYLDWEFNMGCEIKGDYRTLLLSLGYNLRSKKYWEYRREKNRIEHEKLKPTNNIYRQEPSSYYRPCPSQPKIGFSNEYSIKQDINECNDGVVGIYESIISNGYRLAVIRQGDSYQIIYLSGGRGKCWEFGHLKANLRATATTGLFKATWYMENFIANNDCIIAFDGVKMSVVLPSETVHYIKMYPQQHNTSTPIVEPQKWSGTGWALGKGYLVTNHHVVDGARSITIKGIDGNLNTGYSAEVVASDKTNDIAVLKINDPYFIGFGAIPYAVSSRIAEKGEGIFVLGYPMTQVLGNEVKYTAGEINSRTGFQGDVATYQISAPVTHGNSGGPMFDNKGNVIGIVNSGITDKEIAENVGYAIKISYLKILIESAGLNITLPNNNTISTLSKQEKIKKVEKFVFYIECSK